MEPPEKRIGRIVGDGLQLKNILHISLYVVVYLAADVKTGDQYALKAMSKVNTKDIGLERLATSQKRGMRLQQRVSAHPNVLSVLKIIDEPDCTYYVLDYHSEGDLFDNILERKRYVGEDDLAKQVFLQILDAVDFCHSIQLYHRHLTPENILVSGHGRNVKLSGFGCAVSYDDPNPLTRIDPTYEAPGKIPDCATGTITNRSTFVIVEISNLMRHRTPNLRIWKYCDIWSLGILLVILVTGKIPWEEASTEDPAYQAYLRNPDYLKTGLPLSDELNNILRRIFAHNPRKRISLSELKTQIRACSQFTA